MKSTTDVATANNSSKILTFVDSGVLIAAARGTTEVSKAAMEVLDDPARLFSSSVFVRLETIPKAAYNKQDAEREYYEAFRFVRYSDRFCAFA